MSFFGMLNLVLALSYMEYQTVVCSPWKSGKRRLEILEDLSKDEDSVFHIDIVDILSSFHICIRRWWKHCACCLEEFYWDAFWTRVLVALQIMDGNCIFSRESREHILKDNEASFWALIFTIWYIFNLYFCSLYWFYINIIY